MPISVECRFCGKTMLVANEVAGKRFRCPGCLEIIEAPLAPPSAVLTERPALPLRTETKKQSAEVKRSFDDLPAMNSTGSPPRSAPTAGKAETTAQLWSVSSYDYPEVIVTKKQERRPADLRAAHPEAFVEYDKVVNECAIFLIGLGVIIAALFSLLYFSETSSPRLLRMYQIALGLAGSCTFAGLFCFTGWRVVLIMVAVMSASVGIGIATLGLVVHKVVMLPGIGLCIVCIKLISAIQRFPSGQHD